MRLAPQTDNVPLEIRGRPVASVAAVWEGDSEKGLRYLDHILSIGSPVGVTSRVMSYLALQTIADHEFPPGRHYYTKSGYFKTLDDNSIDRMASSLVDIPSPDTQIELAYLGGALQRYVRTLPKEGSGSRHGRIEDRTKCKKDAFGAWSILPHTKELVGDAYGQLLTFSSHSAACSGCGLAFTAFGTLVGCDGVVERVAVG